MMRLIIWVKFSKTPSYPTIHALADQLPVYFMQPPEEENKL